MRYTIPSGFCIAISHHQQYKPNYSEEVPIPERLCVWVCLRGKEDKEKIDSLA